MSKMKNLAIELQDEVMQRITSSEMGEINFLDSLMDLREVSNLLKINQQLIKEWESDNRDYIIDEATAYPDGYRGYIVNEINGRTMFNYKKIEDWKIAKANLSEIEAYYKSAFINKQKGLNTVTDDGELIDVFPEVSYAKNSTRLNKV